MSVVLAFTYNNKYCSAEQLPINCIQLFHDPPQDQKEPSTQNEPISEYTRCSEHTASSTMYVMFCFDLDCSSWQKNIHFPRFLILLVPKIFFFGGVEGEDINSILLWKTWTPLMSRHIMKIFLLEFFRPALPFRYLNLCTLMTHFSFLHWFSEP